MFSNINSIHMSKSFRIVIAEDHPVYREAIANLLIQFPEIDSVYQAGNGREAIDMVKIHQPSLAILDIRMPEIDGLTVAAELSKHNPALRILFLSSLTNSSIVRHALSNGAHGFLIKDSNATEIITAVRALLAGKTYLSEALTKALAWEHLQTERTSNFTDRELQIIRLLCQEYSSLQIATGLNLSERTVDRVRNSILQKSGMKTTAGIVRYAAQHGLLPE
jgi:DNA-binding NarL/FixJ family response regulator